MVRPRSRPSASNSDEHEKRVQEFADKADLPMGENHAAAAPQKDAKRDYKNLNLPLNEYEYLALDALCKSLSRSKSNVLRFALLELAEREGVLIK